MNDELKAEAARRYPKRSFVVESHVQNAFIAGAKWERARSASPVMPCGGHLVQEAWANYSEQSEPESDWESFRAGFRAARPVLSADNREALGSVILHTMLHSASQPNSGALTLEIADAILAAFTLPVTPEPTEGMVERLALDVRNGFYMPDAQAGALDVAERDSLLPIARAALSAALGVPVSPTEKSE